MIIAGTITVGGIFGGVALVQKAAASRAISWALGGVGSLSSGTGLLICGDDKRLQHQDSPQHHERYIKKGKSHLFSWCPKVHERAGAS